MAIGTTTALIGGALLGGIAGSQKDRSSQSQTSTVDAGVATQDEKNASAAVMKNFQDLQRMADLGPGDSDITAGLNSQRDLAAMLESYSKGGYAPTAQDQELAKAQLAPQQVALDQQLRSIREQAARQQALSGRGPTDFVFNNRLNQNQLDLTQQLAAQQTALASQQPMQRLGFAESLAQIRSGLASQALQNRQAILGLGSQIQSAERNFRLGTAARSGNQTTESGGGFKGALSGALGGAGAAFGLMNSFGGMGGKTGPSMDAAGGTTQFSADYLSQPANPSFFQQAIPRASSMIRSPASFQAPQTSLSQSAPINYGAQMGPVMSIQPYQFPQTSAFNRALNPFGGY